SPHPLNARVNRAGVGLRGALGELGPWIQPPGPARLAFTCDRAPTASLIGEAWAQLALPAPTTLG
ncbi:MAG: hypothetical protein OXU20_17175, partial [Myxococcales bacterium]|nr:hypothetical protein [Myxococcales bacterium]